jgi:Tfp pilus assembly protein PilN
MIELNILKERLEKYKNRRVITNLFIIYLGGLLFILMVLGMTFLGNKIQIRKVLSDIRKIEDKMNKEKEVISEIKTKGEATDKLLEVMAFFISEKEKRVLWTNNIGFIGRNVPYGIWLSRLSYTMPSSAKALRIISIEGYMLPDMANERETIDRFVRNLSRGNYFENVKLQKVTKTGSEEDQIVSFYLKCEMLKKGTKDAKTAN